MTYVTYNLPEEEIERYRRDGFARADFRGRDLRLIRECSIGISPLIEITQPQKVWISYTSEAPKVIFARDSSETDPETAIQIETDKKLESVVLTIFYYYPKVYKAEIKPVYIKNR